MTAKKVVRKPATTKNEITPKERLTAIHKDMSALIKKDPKSLTRAELTEALTKELGRMKRAIGKL